MVWEIGQREGENQGEGKWFTNTKGCDYNFQDEYRGREIEDTVRITPCCDHLKCSTTKLKSRINLFTQLNQMQSWALICSWKENTSNYHIPWLHISALACLSCLLTSDWHFMCWYRNSHHFQLHFFAMLLLQSVMQWLEQVRAEVWLERRHNLLQKLRAINETGWLESYLCLCSMSFQCPVKSSSSWWKWWKTLA